MEINLELRSEVLRYSLHLEDGINSLLLLNLGIFDVGRTTRLFGNKAGISYKQKIDLLLDIDVLTKEENAEMELLSIFRNKLLHDIYYNSMLSIIDSLDKGLKSKFKVYFETGQDIGDEKDCLAALRKLFLKNIKTISEKNKYLKEISEQKRELFADGQNRNLHQIDVLYDLIKELSLDLEQSNLEDPEVLKLAQKLFITIKKYQDRFSYAEGKVFSQEVFSSIFGIRRMGEEQHSKMKINYDEYAKAKLKGKSIDG